MAAYFSPPPSARWPTSPVPSLWFLRYEARLRRIHQQNYDMLLRLRQQRQSEPARPEPLPPPPAPTQESAPESVVQADSLHETKGLQNEPAAQHRHRRFRSRRERKM